MFHAVAAALGARENVRGVEIGVEYGINAEIALTEWPHGSLHLTLVEANLQYEDLIVKRLEKRCIGSPDSYVLILGRSADVGPTFPPKTFDFVYIDDDHSYEGCTASINAWKETVKPGGFIGGHDYQLEPVRRAVNYFVDSTGWPSYQSEWDWYVIKS
jgi:predicted O-methyltransferase YrrM